MKIEDVAFRLAIGIANVVKWALISGLIAVLALLFIGPIGWIKMGLLVECKYVEKCAKEHNIEYVESKK